VMDESDYQDIRSTLAGNHAAYARLVERHEGPVFAQMGRFTRDARVLDELVQDVFIEVYMNLHKYRGEAPFLHWVRRIGTRVGYHYWKMEHRDRKLRQLLALQPVLAQAIEARVPSEAAEVLFQMLARLAPKDRLVLTLHFFDECDTREIADRTGWSRTLVRVRIHRACNRLKRLLIEAGYGRLEL